MAEGISNSVGPLQQSTQSEQPVPAHLHVLIMYVSKILQPSSQPLKWYSRKQELLLFTVQINGIPWHLFLSEL